MEIAEKELIKEIRTLIEKYRVQCLWFLKENYFPETPEQVIRILEKIEKHSDRKGFIRAREIKQWLLQKYSVKSFG